MNLSICNLLECLDFLLDRLLRLMTLAYRLQHPLGLHKPVLLLPQLITLHYLQLHIQAASGYVTRQNNSASLRVDPVSTTLVIR